VAEVVVLPRRAGRSLACGDGVTVDEDLDGADVALEIAGVLIGPGQRLQPDQRSWNSRGQVTLVCRLNIRRASAAVSGIRSRPVS
jgi:hypothetical protein